MRNKRILAVMLLLVLVLLLGIGYAVSNKTLTINGTASAEADDNNFVVRFKKTEESYDAPTNLTNAEATVTADNKATITVTGLKKAGDTATATYTIENTSDGIDASVTATVKDFTQNTDFFEVTTTGITGTASSVTAGNTATITVTVKLLKTPVEAKSTAFTVELDATPVQQ